jgi:uncharacterized protein
MTSESQGRFTRHELFHSEARLVAQFYANVIGLAVRGASASALSILRIDRQPIGPVIDTVLAPTMSSPVSGWVSYAVVDDIDSASANAVRLGGTIQELQSRHVDGDDRSLLVRDPQGAMFGMIARDVAHGSRKLNGSPVWDPVGWHELYAHDPKAAFWFYSELFAWQKGPAFSMGAAGEYQVFLVGGQPMGGIMRLSPAFPRSQWNPFFQCGDIDQAKALVVSGSGSVLDGPREVPGGHWTLKCLDPHGMMFALFGHKV